MKKQKLIFRNRIARLATLILAVVGLFVFVGLVANPTPTGFLSALSYAILPLFIVDGKFKELSDADFKTFAEKATPEELAGYYIELNKHKRQQIEALKADAEKNKDEIQALKESFNDMRSKQMDTMEKALEKQGLTIQKLIDERREKATQSVIEQIKSELTKNKEVLAKLKEKQKVDFNFTVKTVGTMLESANITGAIPQYMRIPGVNYVAQRIPFILELISRGTTTSNVIEWIYEITGEGGAGYTTEGNTKNQIDADFALGSEKVQKLTVYIKVSEEMLSDIDFMASYINNKLLVEKLNLKIDAELLSGAGGGSALNGILTQATAWAAGSFAGTIVQANNFDVLRTAINQVIVNKFMPNSILMHPTDVTAMGLTKNADGDYVFPTFILPGGTKEVEGIVITKNTGVSQGTFLVMDGTRATAYFKDDVSVNVGWDGNDFTKNLRTILAEARLALVIETNDTGAFVTGSFSTAITALDKVTA